MPGEGLKVTCVPTFPTGEACVPRQKKGQESHLQALGLGSCAFTGKPEDLMSERVLCELQ